MLPSPSAISASSSTGLEKLRRHQIMPDRRLPEFRQTLADLVSDLSTPQLKWPDFKYGSWLKEDRYGREAGKPEGKSR